MILHALHEQPGTTHVINLTLHCAFGYLGRPSRLVEPHALPVVAAPQPQAAALFLEESRLGSDSKRLDNWMHSVPQTAHYKQRLGTLYLRCAYSSSLEVMGDHDRSSDWCSSY